MTKYIYIDYENKLPGVSETVEHSNTKPRRMLSNTIIEGEYIGKLRFAIYEGVIFRDCQFAFATEYFIPKDYKFAASFKNCVFERCFFDECGLNFILVESCKFVDSLLYNSVVRSSCFNKVQLEVTNGKCSFYLRVSAPLVSSKSFCIVNACAIYDSKFTNFWSEKPENLLERFDISISALNEVDESFDKMFPKLTPDEPFVAYKYVRMKRRIENSNEYAESDTIQQFIDAGDEGFSEFDATWGVPAVTLGGRGIKHVGIAKIIVPEGARASSAFGRKCRCDRLIVEGIYQFGSDTLITELDPLVDVISPIYLHSNPNVINYRPKAVLEEKSFDDNRWKECASGLHFFMTKEEAETYARDISNLDVAKNPKGGWNFEA